jgi:hypothetical protein
MFCVVEDVFHDFVRRHEVVSVEGIFDALLSLADRTVAGYATQHEEAQVVRVDSR